MAGSLNGSLVFLLLKVLGQWRIIGGQVSTTDTLNNNPIDITNKASQDYRELLEGEGLQTRDLTLELYYNSDVTYQLLRSLADSGEKADFRIIRSGTGVNDDITAVISTFGETAPMSDRLSNSVTLAGAQFSDAGPMPPVITLEPEDMNATLGDTITFISRAINWTSVQWYKIGPPDQTTGERPERVEITGSTDRELRRTLSVEDVDSLFQVVYTNANGSAESRLARVLGKLPYAAVSNVYFPPMLDTASTLLDASFLKRNISITGNIDDSAIGVLSADFLKRSTILEYQMVELSDINVDGMFLKEVLDVTVLVDVSDTVDIQMGTSQFLKRFVQISNSVSDDANLTITAHFNKE